VESINVDVIEDEVEDNPTLKVRNRDDCNSNSGNNAKKSKRNNDNSENDCKISANNDSEVHFITLLI
jgi:hypothetical protein